MLQTNPVADRHIRCMTYLAGAFPAIQLPEQFGPGKEIKNIADCV